MEQLISNEKYKINFIKINSNRGCIWSINGINVYLNHPTFKSNQKSKLCNTIQTIRKSLINYEKLDDMKISYYSIINICISIFPSLTDTYIDVMVRKYFKNNSNLITIVKVMGCILVKKIESDSALFTMKFNYGIHENNKIFLYKVKSLIDEINIDSLRKSMLKNENLNMLYKKIGPGKMFRLCMTELLDITDAYINKVVEENVRFRPTINFVLTWTLSKGYRLNNNLNSDIRRFRGGSDYIKLIQKVLNKSMHKINNSIYDVNIHCGYVLEMPKFRSILEKNDFFTHYIKNRPNYIELPTLFKILTTEFKVEFKSYLILISNNLNNKQILVTCSSTLLMVCFGLSSLVINSVFFKIKGPFLNVYLEICREINSNQIDLIGNMNSSLGEISFENDSWGYNYINNDIIYIRNIDYSLIMNESLKKIVKYYFLHKIQQQKNIDGKPSCNKHVNKCGNIINSVIFFIDYLKIESFSEINHNMLTAFMNYFQFEYSSTITGKRLSPTSISKYRTSMKQFLDWYIYECKLGVDKPEVNVFENLQLKNLKNMNKNTPLIACEVLDNVSKNIGMIKNKMIQRVIMIMLNCPRRFKEVAYLEENCLYTDKITGKTKLMFIPWKVLESKLIDTPDTKYEEVYVNDVVVREIQEQIDETKGLREENKSKYIFTYKRNKKQFESLAVLDNSNVINDALNRALVNTLCGELRLTTRQFRKAIACEMILNGATLEEVRITLCQKNVKTTKEYYAEVDKILLSDKHTEFFKEQFNHIFPEKHQKLYSKSEIEGIFLKYCYEYRKVFYRKIVMGTCSRSPLEKCEKNDFKKKVMCATCSKFCTGKPFLKSWIELKEECSQQVEDLVYFYREILKLNYVEYSKFEGYKEMVSEINDYSCIIKAIQRSGITNGVQ
ncbi:hypothetical protein [Clostridium sp.]|jgi:hypothetical protein|uniref:hypothetical protein n=1 Tax=Clostridium sp. TaxID=1506 RepID=UPI003EECE41A